MSFSQIGASTNVPTPDPHIAMPVASARQRSKYNPTVITAATEAKNHGKSHELKNEIFSREKNSKKSISPLPGM